MRNIRIYLILLITTFALAACGGRKAVDGDINVESVDGTAGSSSSTGLDGDGSLDGSGLGGGDLLSQRVIYFEYDSSALTLESEAVVQAHAQYLAGSGSSVILEGHADERGTREYNLALGEDRAKSVANLMQALGVSSSQIQSISYGEERPVSLGSDESAWSLNRRVEILYQ